MILIDYRILISIQFINVFNKIITDGDALIKHEASANIIIICNYRTIKLKLIDGKYHIFVVSNKHMQYIKKFIRWLGIIFLILVILFMVVWAALQVPSIQTKVVHKVTTELSKILNTTVSIDKVDIVFFKTVSLENAYIEDQKQDTLLYAEKLNISIGLFSILNSKIQLNQIDLEGATVHLSRPKTDSNFNYNFILEAFASSDTEKDTTAHGWDFGIENINLKRINFKMDDKYGGINVSTSLDELSTNIELLDIENEKLQLGKFKINNTTAEIVQANDSSKSEVTEKNSTPVVEEIAFPYLGWDLKVSNIEVQNSALIYKLANGHQKKEQLNPEDINLKNLNLFISDIVWDKEVIEARVEKISVKEKSGLKIHNFGVDMKVSPKSISLKDLILKTPYTYFKNTTQVDVSSYSDFVSNLDNIVFSTSFKNTFIGTQDIKHVVSMVGKLPYLNLTDNHPIIIDGKINGKINEIIAESLNLEVKDIITLNLEANIKNLLDPDRLQFNLDVKEISTSYLKANSILRDIALPEGLKTFGDFNLSGKMKGTQQDLTVDELVLTTDAKTGFEITGQISDLHKVSEINLDLSIKELYTNIEDLQAFTPNPLPATLDSLGNISFAGTYKGSLTDFNLVGALKSNLGILESNIELNFVEDYSSATYKGKIALDDFRLGSLLGDSLQVGEVTMDAEVEGSGFEVNSMDAILKLNVGAIEYAAYNYNDIFMDGALKDGIFKGKLNMNDQNASLDFDGTVSLDLDNPNYKFDLNVDTLNLHELNLVDEMLSIHTKMDIDFDGKNLDDFDGELNLTDIKITTSNKNFETDSLIIVSKYENLNERSIEINSAFLKGKIEGDYNLEEIYYLLLAYVSDFFPLDNLMPSDQIVKKFDAFNKTQNFEIFLDLIDPSPIQAFIPTVEYLDGANLKGSFNSRDKLLTLGISVQKIIIDGVGAESISWNTKGEDKQITNNLSINQIETEGGINISQVSLKNKMLNDSFYLRLQVANDSIDQVLDLASNITSASEGYRLEFGKELIINTNEWKIDPTNYINFDMDFLDINNLIFNNENQSVSVKSVEGKTEENVPPIQISFNNFQIGELSNFVNIDNTNFEGSLNGQLTVIDPFENLHYLANLKVPDLTLNKESIGQLSLDFENPANTQYIEVKGMLDGSVNNMTITGNYNFKDQIFDIKSDIKKLELRLIDPIMVGIISQSKGSINGDFTLGGSPEKPDLDGKVNFNEISTVIDFSKTRYKINTGNVTFNNEEINLGTLLLLDRRNDEASLSGKIRHQFFSNMQLDLRLNTNGFTFLNTNAKDNELFYGKLYLRANGDITGPVEQPQIEIKAKTLDGSELNISAFSEEDSFEEESFIIFGNPATYQAQNEDGDSVAVYQVTNAIPANIKLYLELTDGAIFRIIVDPVTGDLLESKGNSDLVINLLPSGEINMFGTYLIKTGKYEFSYTDVIKRNFEIVQGGRIEFYGDPLNAKLNVTAKYTTKATPYELVINESTLSEAETSSAQKRQEANVLMKMRGNISKPELNFDIELPQSEGTVVNSAIQRKLDELRSNPNEMNKQVFGLILLNSFIASSGTSEFADAGESAVLGSVSKLVSKELNKIADKYIKGVEIEFDLNSYKSQYTNDGSGGAVTELGVGVTKKINDRLSFTATGNIDVDASAESSGFTQVAGDFILNYKLTKKGNYLLTVFRRSDFDVLNEENAVKTGAGISISKSFGGIKKNKNEK